MILTHCPILLYTISRHSQPLHEEKGPQLDFKSEHIMTTNLLLTKLLLVIVRHKHAADTLHTTFIHHISIQVL